MKKVNLNILLLDGKPTGTKMVEIGNHTIRSFVIPRSRLDKLTDREDLQQSGIYFLIGKQEETEEEAVYIGIATNLANRLVQHKKDKNKSFWRVAIACTSRDDSLTASANNYLERKCYQLAKEAGRVDVQNVNKPVKSPISEIEKSEIDNYLKDIKTILAVFGFTFLEKATEASPENKEIYFCKGPDADAKGKLTDEGFVVFKDSLARIVHTKGSSEYLNNKLEELLSQKIIEPVSEKQGKFIKDFVFSSPSAASSIVLGRSSNGWSQWEDKNGNTLNKNER